MPQGTLPSQYIEERRSGGLTGLSGLAIYWERQQPAGGGWGVETPSCKPRSCRQDGGAPGSRPCCLIAHGSASNLLAVGVETPSCKATSCRQDRGAPGSCACCLIAHGSASILLAVGLGGGDAVLQAKVLPPRWRRSRESPVLPDRPWERQQPAGRGGGGGGAVLQAKVLPPRWRRSPGVVHAA